MLSEIAQSTYDYQEYPVVMSAVWKRVNQSAKNWRIMYKALSLLEYLIRNGSERAVEDARDHMYQLRSLCDFTARDEGQDQGLNVREKSRAIVELLEDRERLKEEREKARANRGKFGGVSSQKMQGFGGGGGFGSDSGASRGSAGKYAGFSSEDARRQGSGGGGYASGGIGGYNEKPWQPPSRPPAPAPAPAAAMALSAPRPVADGKIRVNLPGGGRSKPAVPPPKVHVTLGGAASALAGAPPPAANSGGGGDLFDVSDAAGGRQPASEDIFASLESLTLAQSINGFSADFTDFDAPAVIDLRAPTVSSPQGDSFGAPINAGFGVGAAAGVLAHSSTFGTSDPFANQNAFAAEQPGFGFSDPFDVVPAADPFGASATDAFMHALAPANAPQPKCAALPVGSHAILVAAHRSVI